MAETDTDPQAHAGSVHVPGIGPVKKKTALYGGVAAVLLVIVYIYMKNRQTAAAAPATAAATGATVTDPAGNVCSTLDPSSGYCPGTAEDQAYYSDQSGVLGGSSGNGIIGYDSSGDPIYSSGGTGVTASTGPGSFSNNAQWAQYAEQGMGSSGNDATAAALGKYITGGEVTADQVTLIDEAIALAGYPPTQGPGGKPPSINQTGVPGSGNPPPPATTVTVPRLTGERVENATSALSALGLKATFGTRKPNVPYHVTSTSPAAGAKVKPGSTVRLSIAQGDT
jgi:hypothetical protein